MRLSVDGSGKVDPGRMLAVRSLSFAEVFEAHIAQDALDLLQRQERDRIRREVETARRHR